MTQLKIARSTSPSAQWEKITPTTAAKLLEGNTHNRTLSQMLVDRYAAEMKRGAWDEDNCETIKIAHNGVVIDGQHRLWAIVESEVTLTLLVARNLDPESFKTIDIGKGRTPGDMMNVAGIKNGNQIAAGASVALALKKKKVSAEATIRTRDLLRSEVMAFALQHREEFEESVRKSVTHGCSNLVGTGVLIGCHFLFSTASKAERRSERADRFFEQLGTGIFDDSGTAKSHPIRTLREKLLANRNSVTRMRNGAQAAFMIKAWNAWVAGRALQVLRMAPGETFPTIA